MIITRIIVLAVILASSNARAIYGSFDSAASSMFTTKASSSWRNFFDPNAGIQDYVPRHNLNAKSEYQGGVVAHYDFSMMLRPGRGVQSSYEDLDY